MLREFWLEHFVILAGVALLYYFYYRHSSNLRMNRILLLLTLILSILIPSLSFEVFPQLVELTKTSSFEHSETELQTVADIGKGTTAILSTLYFAGIFISFLFFLREISQLRKLIRNTEFQKVASYMVAYSASKNSFSFGKYIFLASDDKIQLEHEIAHSQAYHTLDRLFLSILKILLWFNPLIYLFEKWLIENHEFSADQSTIAIMNLKSSAYADYLLKTKSYNSLTPRIANKFSSQLKSRFTMLRRRNLTPKHNYLLVLAFFVVLAPSFTLKAYPEYVELQISPSNDTIPATQARFDTIIVFDPVTKKEVVKIIELGKEEVDTMIIFDPQSNTEKVEIVNRDRDDIKVYLDLEQVRQKVRIDTSVIFDSNTYKESIRIDRIKIPVDVKFSTEDLSLKEYELFDKYGETETHEITSYVGYKGYYVNFSSQHEGFDWIIEDVKGQPVFSAKIKQGIRKFELVEARLPEGEYIGRRSDKATLVKIMVKK